ncbi:hypothetical protein Tco_0986681 [Tanacetum coccineum]
MKLIIKHILLHHNIVSKRPQSDKHGVKINTVLGNLKFINKGKEHLKYGMAVPEEMMSDTLKAYSSYLNYMTKSLGTQSGKGQGKGLNTKKDVESKEFVDSKSLEETKADEEKICLNERHFSLVIGREENKEIDEGTLDHSTMKLKGVENVSSEGSSMIPDTPNDPTDSSSSSHSGSDDELKWYLMMMKEPRLMVLRKMEMRKLNKRKPKMKKLDIRTMNMRKLEKNKIWILLANEKHLELFNALMNSMGVDESVAKGDLDRTIKLNKKQHDDQDPHADLEKLKKKRQKDTDASKSQKDKFLATTFARSSRSQNHSCGFLLQQRPRVLEDWKQGK